METWIVQHGKYLFETFVVKRFGAGGEYRNIPSATSDGMRCFQKFRNEAWAENVYNSVQQVVN